MLNQYSARYTAEVITKWLYRLSLGQGDGWSIKQSKSRKWEAG